MPAVIIGKKYLFLENENIPELMNALMAGDGIETPLLDNTDRIQ